MREDGKLRGYITLLADCLKVEKPLLEAENVQYRTFPAIKIGLLAVDKRAKGLGIELVKWAFTYIASTLAPRVGARFVTVDALFDPDSGYDTAPYYEKKFGFSSVDPATKPSAERPFTTMFYDLKTILDLIESQPKAK